MIEPSIEELDAKGLDKEGKCIINSFKVTRKHFGFVKFMGPLNVANINVTDIGDNTFK